MFCPKCGSMMVPSQGKFKCKKCDTVQEKGTSVNVSATKVEFVDKEVLSDVTTLPKTHVLCPQCQHTEAYFTIQQTRAADEPETRIYRCCKCNHNWREY